MKKRKSTFLTTLLVACCMVMGMGVQAHAMDYVTVNGYDPKLDYGAEIQKALADGSPYALKVGGVYEKQRNLKIEEMGLPYKTTDYFTKYKTAAEILNAMEEDRKPSYTEDDLYWLSRIINAEAGSNWLPDWFQRDVGSVVLNRVKSTRFANSIKGVAFESGQYYCATSGSIYQTPSDRAVENAKYILENGSTLPEGVLGQSEFVQGEVHSQYTDPYLGTTTYFCYM